MSQSPDTLPRVATIYATPDKRGQGATVAALTDAMFRAQDADVVLVTTDRDAFTYCGAVPDDDGRARLTPTLEAWALPEGWDYWPDVLADIPADRVIVADTGTDRDLERILADIGGRVLWPMTSCYAAISRAAERARKVGAPDGIVWRREEGRAILPAGIEAVIGAPVVATIPTDPAVARAADAGLLATRTPRALAHAMHP